MIAVHEDSSVMILPTYLALLPLVLALTSTSLAAVISVPASLAASGNASLTQADSNVVVDPEKHPDWAGDLKPKDCIAAWNLFKERVQAYPQTLPIMFWSATLGKRPRDFPNFQLPFGTQFGKHRLGCGINLFHC